MTVQERIYEHLRNIAPRALTNKEIARDLHIQWPGTVYNATRKLLARGLIRGEMQAHEWVFAAQADRSAPFNPTQLFTWESNGDARSWQVRWLVPLLNSPEGRVWFLERLHCPCSTESARGAQVFHFCHPLRDLFRQDFRQCQGDREQEDRFIAYYNELFGLPSACGIDRVWRPPHKDSLHLPDLDGKAGWSIKLLRKHIAVDRFRKRARWISALMRADTDVMLLADHHVVLVLCIRGEQLPEGTYVLQRRLAGILEHRLGRMFHLGAVVDGAEQLGIVNIPYVRWQEITEWSRKHLGG